MEPETPPCVRPIHCNVARSTATSPDPPRRLETLSQCLEITATSGDDRESEDPPRCPEIQQHWRSTATRKIHRDIWGYTAKSRDLPQRLETHRNVSGCTANPEIHRDVQRSPQHLEIHRNISGSTATSGDPPRRPGDPTANFGDSPQRLEIHRNVWRCTATSGDGPQRLEIHRNVQGFTATAGDPPQPPGFTATSRELAGWRVLSSWAGSSPQPGQARARPPQLRGDFRTPAAIWGLSLHGGSALFCSGRSSNELEAVGRRSVGQPGAARGLAPRAGSLPRAAGSPSSRAAGALRGRARKGAAEPGGFPGSRRDGGGSRPAPRGALPFPARHRRRGRSSRLRAA